MNGLTMLEEPTYEFIKAYANIIPYRVSFNELAKKTFGLDFKDWYQNGFWGENYIPYSLLDGDRVIANVSVNITDFDCGGELRHYIQLGTVMTDEKYRGQGLIRRLMQEIENDYGEGTDGFYLFANDSVLDFYPKFGYAPAEEYQYFKEVKQEGRCRVKPVPMKEKKAWDSFVKIMQKSVVNSSFKMQGNTDLIMFYITKFMQENVFYIEDADTYVIAELEEGELILGDIFAKKQVDIHKIIEAFGSSVKRATLNFTPLETEGFQIKRLQEADTTLFVKGKKIQEISQRRFMFPTLSHA